MGKFSHEQQIFIIKSFARNISPNKVRREFLEAYKIQGGRMRSKYRPIDFARVNKHFETKGSTARTKKECNKTKRTAEKLEEINDLLSEETMLSVRKIAPTVSVSASTVWRILRYDLKARFYHPATVQPLSVSHIEQRKVFCSWILEQPADLVQRIIWTDEKIFVLKQRPHRKNDGRWAKENPQEVVETNDRNGQKIMIFVAIVNGRIPIVHAFVGDDGRNQSVNGNVYLELLKEVAWPALRSTATRRRYWWMQDGAPPHCTTLAKEFLIEKFQGRVISRGTPITWPAHSPDLNPLDFYFWGEAQQEVYREQPESIESLVQCVKRFAETREASTIERVAENVLKRAKMCLEANGGHFQHLLK